MQSDAPYHGRREARRLEQGFTIEALAKAADDGLASPDLLKPALGGFDASKKTMPLRSGGGFTSAIRGPP